MDFSPFRYCLAQKNGYHGVMRFFLSLCLAILAGCGQRELLPPPDNTPLDRRLTNFADLQNQGDWDALPSHFTKRARIQSPVTPQGASVDQYLRALAKAPYMLAVNETEIVYAFPDRALTRSNVTIGMSGRPSWRERLAVNWQFEDGYWRMARMVYSDWPAIIGTWRRSGLRQEGSIELRIYPGGRYVVYTAEDYSAPAFKGDYRLEGNQITLSDVSSFEANLFESGSGRYSFIRTPTGITLRKLREENTWRDARYQGDWAAHSPKLWM